MRKEGGRKNVLVVTFGFFLMFVLVVLFSGIASSISFDRYGEPIFNGGSEPIFNGGSEPIFNEPEESSNVEPAPVVETTESCGGEWSFSEAVGVVCVGGASGQELSGPCTIGEKNNYIADDGGHPDFWDCESSRTLTNYFQMCEPASNCFIKEEIPECDGEWETGSRTWSSGSLSGPICGDKTKLYSFAKKSGSCSAGDTNTYIEFAGSFCDPCGNCNYVEPEPTWNVYNQVCLESTSDPVCVLTCGNGVIDSGEECDDGNTNNNDGCSSTCEIESGYICDELSPTKCDPIPTGTIISCEIYSDFGAETSKSDCFESAIIVAANCDAVPGCAAFTDMADCGLISSLNWDVSCVPDDSAVCGDGLISPGEECDDSNTNNNDGCSSTCVREVTLVCCDDDDNDGWTGKSSYSSFFGTCTNLFNFGREKVCSDYSFLGSEGDEYDNDASRNPGVAEVCGNEIDENADGIIEECAPTCNDGVQNQGETSVDCGGSFCSACPVAPTCSDGVQNGEETDIDCGTVECGACVIPPYCGDGNIDSGEACDGSNLGGSLCADSPQYTGGSLSCYSADTANACTIDYSGCINVPVSRNYWADMNGNEITDADLGDTIQMIAEDISSGTFSIKEDDFFDDDDIRDVEGLVEGNDFVGVWTITQEDLDKADENSNEFYFEIGGVKSGNLNINPNEDDTLMTVSIKEGDVDCGSYFNEGTSADIEIVANDPDSIIVGSVSVYNEIIEFGNGGVSFTQLFDVSGNVQILIEASTLNGEDRRRVISNVMVLDKEGNSYVDGVYVAACIIEPEDFSNILGSVVDFDVSSTRGIRVTDGIIDELIPGVDLFSWFWTFYPGGVERNFIDSTEEMAYRFTAQFPVPGVNTAELRVEVN